MDRFNLGMSNAGHNRRAASHVFRHEKTARSCRCTRSFRRVEEEQRLHLPCSSNPVLRSPKFYRRFVGAPYSCNQNCVDLPEQIRQRGQPPAKRCHIVRDFPDVFLRHGRRPVIIETGLQLRMTTVCLRSGRRQAFPCEHEHRQKAYVRQQRCQSIKASRRLGWVGQGGRYGWCGSTPGAATGAEQRPSTVPRQLSE